MGSRVFQPSMVSGFWVQIRLGLSPAEAASALGVSRGAVWKWLIDAGGVKPRVHQAMTDGPRPRLTIEERIEIQVGVGRGESLRSIGGRLRPRINRYIDRWVDCLQRCYPDRPRESIIAAVHMTHGMIDSASSWPPRVLRMSQLEELMNHVALAGLASMSSLEADG
jgi:hypothetical protein